MLYCSGDLYGHLLERIEGIHITRWPKSKGDT